MDREFVGRNRVKVLVMKHCVVSSYLCYCLCASETLCVNMLTFLCSEFNDSCCWMSGCKVAAMILSLGVSSLFAEILLTASEINDLKTL